MFKNLNKSLINQGYVPNILLLALLLFYSFILFPQEVLVYKIIIWLTTFIVTLCLFKINILLLRVFLISIGILAAIFYPINNLFGPVSSSNVEALMNTDYAEASSYLSIVPFNLYIKSLLLFLIPLYLSFFTFRFFKLRTSLIFVIIIAGLYLSNRYYFTYKMNFKSLEGAFNTIPTKLLGNITKFYLVTLKGMRYQAHLLHKKDDWKIESDSLKKQLYIFIIGESVRRDVFSNQKLFSFIPLDTIPKVNFNSVVSYGYVTIPSIKNAFVLRKDNTPGEPYFPDNIVNLAKKAGFHTEWFSNQGFVGDDDNYISAIAKCADYSKFLNEKQYFDTRTSDRELIKILEQRLLLSGNQPSVYFLHTIGSHPSACRITNGHYDKFVESDEISCYIKSISDTKKLIYEIYELAKKSRKTFSIVYFSDHGITYDYANKIFTHNHSKEEYTIPFFYLADDLSKNQNISAYRNLGDFINFFQEITGIKTSNITYDFRFISEDYDKNWNHLADGLIFNNLKDNPLPF